MKKMKQWVMAATLTVCGAMMMLTSCTDTIGTADNPVNPEQPVNPTDELAKETFMHEDWMDRSVKPGDSFWQFAVGSWLKDAAYSFDFGTMTMAGIKQKMLLSNDDVLSAYDSPGHTMQLILGPTPSADDEMAVLEGVLARMKQGDDVTKADVIRNIGTLADLGYCPFLGHDIWTIDGTLRYVIIPGLSYSDEGKTLEEITELFKTLFQNKLGIDTNSEEGARLLKNVAEIDLWINNFRNKWATSSPEHTLIGSGRRVFSTTPLRANTVLAKTSNRTSAIGNDVAEVFREVFHIDENTYYLPEVDRIFELFDQYDIATLQTYLKCFICGKLSNVMFCNGLGKGTVFNHIKTQTHSIFLDYLKAMLYKDADCEGALQLLEEMRKLFAQRIERLDWLSDATKAKALEKLQAMGFIVRGPEVTFDKEFILTGKTPVEDLVQYKTQVDAYMRNVLAGKPGRDYIWEYLVISPNIGGIEDVNAFYDPDNNLLVILPVFLQGDLFPADKNHIMRYVTLMVFGHEMTHGYDNRGAGYDATGRKVNWWTAEDKAKFESLHQGMIDRYNELEQLPGVHADGKKTLGENIADLGGFNLAWELWNNKLKADGLTGEALRYQQRQFLLEYVNLWKAVSTESSLKYQFENDPHSANHNRVNGVVRLIDDWYDLFGVKPGDKLYVAPADRVRIW